MFFRSVRSFLFPLYSTLHVCVCVCLFFYVIFSKHQRKDARCFVCIDHRWNGHVAEAETIDRCLLRIWCVIFSDETRQTQFANENRAQDREEEKEKIDDTMTMFFFCCSADFDDTEKNKIPRGNFFLGRFVYSRGQTGVSPMCMASTDTPSLDTAWMQLSGFLIVYEVLPEMIYE